MATWKPGRGRLGPLTPLLGEWTTQHAVGGATCTRTFAKILGGSHIGLDAVWLIDGGKTYAEHAVIGTDRDGVLRFWSFTSDGKDSSGTRVEAPDVHPLALAFVAEMPAGTARQAYWPGDDGTVHFVVESWTKKGWNRFLEHVYVRAA